MKTKIILDIGFLGHAHDEKAARRGVQRVAWQIFNRLRTAETLELFYVATAHLAGAFDFLQAQSILPEERLFCQARQLARSRRGRDIACSIRQTIADRSLPARFRRRMLAELVAQYLRGEKKLDSSWLDGADIYHTPHTPFPQAVQDHPRIKKFITLHDFIPLKNPEYFPGNGRQFMDAVRACLTPENFAFCVSETTRNDTLNFSSIPPEHVFVTPLAADEKIFHSVTDAAQIAAVRARCGIPDGPYFLALSAPDPHKNFPHLIRCFGALVESGELTDTSLVIVGANPERNPEVRAALAQNPRVKSGIVLPGFVPDEDLAAVYSGATAFLFPSLAEGFGIPPLEAMQCGTPVIASNTTSMPEVIGDAGILLPPTEQDDWCQAMLQVAQQAALRTKLREKSLQRCKLFTWQRFTDATLRGYRKSLEAI